MEESLKGLKYFNELVATEVYNDVLFARYMFQLRCKVTLFHGKRAECATFL